MRTGEFCQLQTGDFCKSFLVSKEFFAAKNIKSNANQGGMYAVNEKMSIFSKR